MAMTEAQRKGVGIAVTGWLLVVLLLYAIANIGAVTETTPGERATAGLLAARNAMARYKQEHGDYRNVSTARLRKLDADVPAELEEPVTFEDIYALTLAAPSGVTYRLGVGKGGRETRDCSVPKGTPPGECDLASPDATNGTWE
jgi:hypothetical protein